MMPGARLRGLLNPPPLRGVLLLEGSGFDGLAELELYGAIVFAAGLASIVYPLLLQPLLERWDDASLGDR
jgi:hypothetical protein